MKLALILPTRHRAAHAIAAIRSLLVQGGCDFSLIVSDNSSDEEEVRRLEEFCRASPDPRLVYIRPPEALPMPTHWNWALEQAFVRTDATHFGVQYDRKIWKSDHLRLLAAACESSPSTLVTYACDFTFPAAAGTVTYRTPASGKLYEILSTQVLELTSRGMIYEMGMAWPILSNCMVPRDVLERIRTRFGDFCDSSTPDAAFGFRFCAIEEQYLHFDRALAIVYGFDLSNGVSQLRGERDGTWGDFKKLWGDRTWAEASPIPGLGLGQNVSFHEYNLVQRAVGEERCPPLERSGYLRELARALDFIRDPVWKAEMVAVLESHGWRAEPPHVRPLVRRILSRVLRPRPARQRTFADDEAAVEYLLTHARALEPRNELLAPLAPVEVPFPR